MLTTARRKRILWIGGGLIALWLTLAAVQVTAAYRSATSGLDQVSQLGSVATDDLDTLIGSIGGDTDDVPEETAAQLLSGAAADFGNARESLASPFVRPLFQLPVVGRQLSSARALAEAAEMTAESASVAFEELNGELSGTAQTPDERLRTAQRTEAVLTELRSRLAEVELGPTDKLLPPLAGARNRFSEDYRLALDTLETAVVAVRGVNDFLVGPTTYLVLAANNAEMRAGSGMFLQVGTLSVEDGSFSTSDFTPAKELFLNESGATLDPDIAERWGWLIPDREWRNLALSPRFSESARMATEMWSAGGNGEVDGVLAIDVAGLEELLEITGPVNIDTDRGTSEITADNVADDLMLGQYEDFVDQRDERRDRLGKVADGVFDAFNTRSWSASKLLAALRRSGAGRHIMLWSVEPVQQQAWEALDATGEIGEDSLMLNILSRGGNKLDQFLDVRAEVQEVEDAPTRRLAVDVTLENTAPRTLPYYVEGPYPNSQLAAGDYLGLLSLTLPSGAGNPTMSSGEILISGDDGPARMVATEVLLPLGSEVQLRIEFDLPESWKTLEVLPSARIPPVRWTVGPHQWTDNEPATLDLGDT